MGRSLTFLEAVLPLVLLPVSLLLLLQGGNLWILVSAGHFDSGKRSLIGTDGGKQEIEERAQKPLQGQMVLCSEQLKDSSLSWGWSLWSGSGTCALLGRKGTRGGKFTSGYVCHSFLNDASNRSYCVGFPVRQTCLLLLGQDRGFTVSLRLLL